MTTRKLRLTKPGRQYAFAELDDEARETALDTMYRWSVDDFDGGYIKDRVNKFLDAISGMTFKLVYCGDSEGQQHFDIVQLSGTYSYRKGYKYKLDELYDEWWRTSGDRWAKDVRAVVDAITKLQKTRFWWVDLYYDTKNSYPHTIRVKDTVPVFGWAKNLPVEDDAQAFTDAIHNYISGMYSDDWGYITSDAAVREKAEGYMYHKDGRVYGEED